MLALALERFAAACRRPAMQLVLVLPKKLIGFEYLAALLTSLLEMLLAHQATAGWACRAASRTRRACRGRRASPQSPAPTGRPRAIVSMDKTAASCTSRRLAKMADRLTALWFDGLMAFRLFGFLAF